MLDRDLLGTQYTFKQIGFQASAELVSGLQTEEKDSLVQLLELLLVAYVFIHHIFFLGSEYFVVGDRLRSMAWGCMEGLVWMACLPMCVSMLPGFIYLEKLRRLTLFAAVRPFGGVTSNVALAGFDWAC